MRTVPRIVATCLAFALSLQGQQTNQKKDEKPPETTKVRAFVTDSQSWEMSGGFGVSNGSGGGGVRGGARPQTAEIVKTFGERCPEVTVTNNRDKADYVVLLDHEGGKGWARKRNKVAVFNRDGDAIYSGSTRSLGNSVKDACEAIEKDRGKPAEKLAK